MSRMLVAVMMLFAFVAGAATIGGTTMRTDPVLPASLAKEITELKRRIGALERSNPLQRASAHDGTTTRLELGTFSHPYSNPVGLDDFGAVVRNEDGAPVFLVDSGGLTIPGNPVQLQNGDASGSMVHGHSSGSWTDALWNHYFVGMTGEVFSVDLNLQCGAGISSAQARLVTNAANGGDNTSDPITLNCTGSYESYRWHWNPGVTVNPNDVLYFTIETRITGGAGTINVYQPRWSVLRSAVAVDTNVTG